MSDHARSARRLLRSARSGVLATALAKDRGRPYGSLVTVACDVDGSPIFLLSQLSDHTRNLLVDGRASLVVEAASNRANPQTGPRLSLIGTVQLEAEVRLRSRFLARHPGAALYVDFADFAFWRMVVESGHWVGGFGVARWLDTSALTADRGAAEDIADAENAILDALNGLGGDAVDRAVQKQLGRRGHGWQAIALDAEGCDFRRGQAVARLNLDAPAAGSAALRAALLDYLK